MAKLKWHGTGDGSYMSGDGRFLVAQVTVPGKKNPRQVWALYGRVYIVAEADDEPPAPWCWGERPLAVEAQKGQCQAAAESSDYDPPIRRCQGAEEKNRRAPEDDAPLPGRCPECTVRFEARPGHKYEEWCGSNCAAEAFGRVLRVLGHGVTLLDREGNPLGVESLDARVRQKEKAS
jgi:hypothetical protein